LKLAAIAGADPYSLDLTPFDIYWMAQGVLEERWDHTASLMMMQYNCNAKKPKEMLAFHPFRKKEHTGKKGELTGVPLARFRKMCKNWKDK